MFRRMRNKERVVALEGRGGERIKNKTNGGRILRVDRI